MSEVLTTTPAESYPWVKFLLHGERYCVTSKQVQSMGAIDNLTGIPDREAWFLGMMERAGQLIPVVDLRALLHLPDLKSDLDAFEQMKQAHLSWVGELEASVRDDRPFEGNRDPHKCTFGSWYDNYKSGNSALDLILEEIGEPHEQLHYNAGRIEDARAAGDQKKAETLLDETLTLCHEKILPLLDQLIKVYNEVNKGMVIVLNSGTEGNSLGIVVDGIVGLEEFTDKKDRDSVSIFGATQFIKGIYVSVNKHIYFELDADRILGLQANLAL